MSTLTAADLARTADWLRDHLISRGLGTRVSARSLAAINLAFYGRLSDEMPPCMCPVIRHWIIAKHGGQA